jgi:hypothetical protein
MATLRIVLPNEPDAELIELAQKMRDQSPLLSLARAWPEPIPPADRRSRGHL